MLTSQNQDMQDKHHLLYWVLKVKKVWWFFQITERLECVLSEISKSCRYETESQAGHGNCCMAFVVRHATEPGQFSQKEFAHVRKEL